MNERAVPAGTVLYHGFSGMEGRLCAGRPSGSVAVEIGKPSDRREDDDQDHRDDEEAEVLEA